MSAIPEAPIPEQPAPFVPPEAQALEKLLPQYEIRELIAHGGMGAVYSGLQRDLDRPVAIKILPPDAGRDKESIDRFRTEAKAMARLTHPHIPAVYEFGVVQEFCVLVMELVEGPNVYTLVRQGKIAPPQALEVLAQVCDAVQFAHSRGIIHGDIKPGNILLNQDGQVKLADFGLARLMGPSGDSASWTAMGTPEYAAPELYDKNVVPDHRADIYSLGVVLHEMLTGAPPVGEFELPGEGLGLDPRVDEIIARCMEFVPDNRYQTAQEVRVVLRDIIEGRNVPVPPPVKAPARRIFRAARKTPVGAKKRPSPSQTIAPATQSKLAPGPKAERHPAVNTPPKKGARKIVIMEGAAAPRRMSDATKRNLLIGAAVAAIAAAIIIMATRDKAPENQPFPEVAAPAPEKTNPPVETPVSPPPREPEKPIARTTPPAPEPATKKVEPVPVPKPDPKAAVPTAAYDQLHTVRITWRDEWNSAVENKLNDELTRLSGLYGKALQKLEDVYLNKGDAASVLAVRTEVARFEKTREALKPDALSKNEQIAKHQLTLNAQVEKLRAGVKLEADAVKEKYLLALRQLEKKFDETADKAGSKVVAAEFARVTGLADVDLKNYFNAEDGAR